MTLKRLKVLHSQEFKSQSHTSVQTLTLAQSTINTQPTILSHPTIPSAIPTPLPEVVDIEDSDEEQGLQANIFNEISSPPTQATIKPTLSRARPLEQPIAEQLIKHTTDAQPE